MKVAILHNPRPTTADALFAADAFEEFDSAATVAAIADALAGLGVTPVAVIADRSGERPPGHHEASLPATRPHQGPAYYLYQCDPVQWGLDFWTSVRTGLDIIEALRGHTTGFAVPTYVIDAPGGGGKIPLQPQYVEREEGDRLQLRNYAGKRYVHHEP